jgi:uncharacterized protein YkwD
MVQEMRRRPLLLCVLLVLLAVPAAVVPASAATTTAKAGEQRDGAFEQGILREVNRLRIARGLRALTLSASLQAAANFQSRDMVERGYFDHDQPGGASFGARLRHFYPASSGSPWLVGENLLWSSQGITPVAAVKLWVASPPHRRNLFDPTWREFGTGAIDSAAPTGAFAEANGPVVVVTMDFGSRSASRTTAVAQH